MKRLKFIALGLIACFAAETAVATDTVTEQLPSARQVTVEEQTGQPDRIVSPNNPFGVTNGFDPRNLRMANMSCGFPPFPPLGCKVGACVCDQYGNNCQWTFICS